MSIRKAKPNILLSIGDVLLSWARYELENSYSENTLELVFGILADFNRLLDCTIIEEE